MEKKTLIVMVAAFFVMAGIMVVAQPVINSVTDAPDPVEMPGYNNITADITNATSAYVEISYPNATQMGNFSMITIRMLTPTLSGRIHMSSRRTMQPGGQPLQHITLSFRTLPTLRAAWIQCHTGIICRQR